MTIATGRRAATEVVVDIAKADPGTADFIAEALIYEALAEEVDRVRPFLERDGARVIAKRVEGALENIAKRYASATPSQRAELEEMAGELAEMLIIAKDDSDTTVATPDNPQTPWWDARNAEGRFTSGGRGAATRGTIDALNMFAGYKGQKSKDVSDAAAGHMRQIARNNRYDNARVLGNALGSIGHKTGTGSMTAAGHLVRLVGEIGPEAQNIFGRGLKRLAYRYRGTERRPNEALAAGARAIANDDESKKNDRVRLTEIGNLGLAALYGHLPTLKLAELSLDSGKMPPSRGLLFDAHGNVVSESVGYHGDHYLPFDLKNLKRLHGGQYVRTRTTGGLTDEDIYTGLLTGARQVQVISNSGVFTVEFDPQLRGGRRYSDKARQMVGRYADLLSSINKETLLSNDLSPKEKATLRQRALTKAKGDSELAGKYYKTMEDEARAAGRFATKDDDELMDEAGEQARQQMGEQQRAGQVKGVSSRTLAQRQADIFRDLKSQQRAEQVRYYRLDGEGYEAAMQALKQEFPLYIRRATYEPLLDWARRRKVLDPDRPLPPRPGKDIGYTRRGMLGPKDRGDTGTTARPAAEEGAEEQPTEGQRNGQLPSFAAGAAAGAQPGHELLTDPQSPLREDLAQALDDSLTARDNVDMRAPSSPDISATAAAQEGYEAWSQWLLDAMPPAEQAAHLMNPATPEKQIDLTISALEKLRGLIHNEDWARGFRPERFDEAIKLLNRVKVLRQPFNLKTDADDPVLTAPPVGTMAPPLLPDVADLVGDNQALADYAEANPEVAERARAIRASKDAERQAHREVGEALRRIRAIKQWPLDAQGLALETHTPTLHGLTAEEVNEWNKPEGPQDSELYQALEQEQTAWALARAAEVTEAMTGSEVPELSPKVQKRDARSGPHRVAKRNRPEFYARSVSKSGPLQPRLDRSAISPQSLRSGLYETLAKRLTEDPEYLSKLLQGQLDG